MRSLLFSIGPHLWKVGLALGIGLMIAMGAAIVRFGLAPDKRQTPQYAATEDECREACEADGRAFGWVTVPEFECFCADGFEP